MKEHEEDPEGEEILKAIALKMTLEKCQADYDKLILYKKIKVAALLCFGILCLIGAGLLHFYEHQESMYNYCSFMAIIFTGSGIYEFIKLSKHQSKWKKELTD